MCLTWGIIKGNNRFFLSVLLTEAPQGTARERLPEKVVTEMLCRYIIDNAQSFCGWGC